MRLAQRARLQATRFGARFITGWEVTGLTVASGGGAHCVHTDGGDVRARSVVIATGAAYRKLGIPALEELTGRGVHYGSAMTRRARWRGWTSWWSVAATRPVRLRCTWPASPAR